MVARAEFEALAESVDELVFITELGGRMLWASSALERHTGFTVADFQFEQPDNPFLHPDDAARVGEFLAGFVAGEATRSEPIENRFFDRARVAQAYRSRISKIRWGEQPALLFVTRRVVEPDGEARRAAERLVQVSQLDSLGLLAGGIAHEVNNALTTVLASASLIRRAATAVEREQSIEEIEGAVRRTSALVDELLALAGKTAPVSTTVELDAVVREALEEIGPQLARHARVELVLPASASVVRGDPVRLRQMVGILLLEAAHGQPAGGRLVVRVVAGRCDDGELLCGERPDDVVARLEIGGRGLIAARHLLDSFPGLRRHEGGAVGVGLPALAGIVRAHDGAVLSRVEGGLDWLVIGLPIAAAGGRASAVRGRPRRGRVLVVDDEAQVRYVMAAILEDEGFEVLSTGDAESALATGVDRLDAAVLDLHLPGKNGLELAHALRGRHPALPVLLVSGFLAEVADLGAFEQLAKPFGADDLVAALARAMAA